MYQLGLFLLASIAGFLVLGTLLGTFMTNFVLICGLAVVGGIGIGDSCADIHTSDDYYRYRQSVAVGWWRKKYCSIFIFRFQTPDWLLYAAAVVLMILGLYVQFVHTARKVG